MVLVLGNYMNGNTTRGGASGIKISSINKVGINELMPNATCSNISYA